MRAHRHGPITALCLALLSAPVWGAPPSSPHGSAAEFDKKLTRDTRDSPTRESSTRAQPAVSYAEVVQRILPSVVSIGTYSRSARRGLSVYISPEDLENIPPRIREFLDEWLGRGDSPPPGENSGQPAPKATQTGFGSGVLLTGDGYILTNHHVVAKAEELKVEVPGRGKPYTARVVGSDPQTDIALLKIEPVEAEKFPTATLGEIARLRVGDPVLAIGSPMGLEHSVTHGIVSGLGRNQLGIIGNSDTGEPGYENFIQTDASINPGNSGGPLLDAHGRVVGLNTAIETRTGRFAGVGLAIPIDMAISVARELVESGQVRRGYLGIEIDPVDPSMATYLGLQPDEGVLVNSVQPDSPAASAGFEEGDAITSINNQKIASPPQLRLAIATNHPGSEVKVGVVRYNEKNRKADRFELSAKLGKPPEKGAHPPEKAPPQTYSAESHKPFTAGVNIRNLDAAIRRDYQLKENEEGVVVTSVATDSPAAAVLEEGDILLQINHKPVRNIHEALSAKAEPGFAMQLKLLRNGLTKFVALKG